MMECPLYMQYRYANNQLYYSLQCQVDQVCHRLQAAGQVLPSGGTVSGLRALGGRGGREAGAVASPEAHPQQIPV